MPVLITTPSTVNRPRYFWVPAIILIMICLAGCSPNLSLTNSPTSTPVLNPTQNGSTATSAFLSTLLSSREKPPTRTPIILPSATIAPELDQYELVSANDPLAIDEITDFSKLRSGKYYIYRHWDYIDNDRYSYSFYYVSQDLLSTGLLLKVNTSDRWIGPLMFVGNQLIIGSMRGYLRIDVGSDTVTGFKILINGADPGNMACENSENKVGPVEAVSLYCQYQKKEETATGSHVQHSVLFDISLTDNIIDSKIHLGNAHIQKWFHGNELLTVENNAEGQEGINTYCEIQLSSLARNCYSTELTIEFISQDKKWIFANGFPAEITSQIDPTQTESIRSGTDYLFPYSCFVEGKIAVEGNCAPVPVKFPKDMLRVIYMDNPVAPDQFLFVGTDPLINNWTWFWSFDAISRESFPIKADYNCAGCSYDVVWNGEKSGIFLNSATFADRGLTFVGVNGSTKKIPIYQSWFDSIIEKP